MLTGQQRNDIDKIWKEFWQNGMTDPLSIIKQITYLLFIRSIDKQQEAKEKQANKLRMEVQDPIYTEDQRELRWNVFKDKDPEQMFSLFRKEGGVFDFIKNLGAKGGLFAETMRYANFDINSPKLLDRVVQMLDQIKLEDRDTKGDVYEYLLSKLSSAGINGQFRTPKHIIRMMVDLLQPQTDELVCDPAAGSAGFLVSVVEYLRENYPDEFYKKEFREHFNNGMFNGFESDNTMVGISAMNLQMHGIDNPKLKYMDALSGDNAIKDKYSLILANPPFTGSVDYDGIELSLKKALNLGKTAKSAKTELLFLALMLRMLRPGGRCAVIVPAGVLFGSTKSHLAVRKKLIDENQLQAVISMPSGVFKPYTGVATAILVFTKTGTGGTDKVWFYDMKADGYTLDDKREILGKPDEKEPEIPTLRTYKHEENNIPDIIEKFHHITQNLSASKDLTAFAQDRSSQHFFVSVDEIREENYNLSFNLYQEIVYEEIKYDSPKVIIDRISQLDMERKDLMKELGGLLG
ncbi:type I restriction-modification system subunit M [Plebeiibacterium marinum]|uniref:site-specific DNA-methyltransferase (adenine-specific) n=1 Tax=Plebeiibacterium marinum TaxID=2992111 RepID=A0AAE3MGH9_9BACT|nr:class I SAM-dependent DNA methyltransferase [Plebeiobacterium marinum]MCW3807061.1 type I restriction-modification system subunit M [Plebeiobacterium marinum]